MYLYSGKKQQKGWKLYAELLILVLAVKSDTVQYCLKMPTRIVHTLIFLGYYWILFLLPKIQMAGWVKDLEQNSILCVPDVLRN
ncbi:hypothetical protein GRJ2_001886100 [Grus japonensis]|uniref:Uncharacterized protein n=1 Tax=Grus japonensis TaxID=30415 RepID=A0ABC9X933_GRUJA